MSNSSAVLLLLCMLASSLDFGDSIGHHLRDNFNVGNRGDQISSFHHVDADGHGYHAAENIDNEVGKDKHKVITNAKLTATVMASDFHEDSYTEHHEDENEQHLESSKDLMLDTANQHGAVRHHLDSVLADESSDDSSSDDAPAGAGRVQSGWAGSAPSPALSPPAASRVAPAAAPASAAAASAPAPKAAAAESAAVAPAAPAPAPAVAAAPKAAAKSSRGQTSQGTSAIPSGEAAAAATAGGNGDDDEFARDHRGHGARGHHHHQRHRGDLGHDEHYERAHTPDHLHHGRIRENAPEYGAEHELEHDHRHEHRAAHGRHAHDFSEDDEPADQWRPEREDLPEDHHRTRQSTSQDDFGRGFAEFGQIGDFESEYDHTADPFPEHDYYEN